MPYAPGISYQGPQFLAQMGLQLSQNIQDAFKKHQEMMKNLGESDAIMEFATKQGLVSPQQITDYAGMSAAQKANRADALAKTITLGMHQKEFEAEQKYRYAALKNARDIAAMSRAAEDPNAPLQFVTHTDAEGNDVTIARLGRSFQVIKDPKDMNLPQVPVMDPTSGNQVGWRIGNTINYFRTVDPMKTEMAKLFSGAGGGGADTGAPATPAGGDSGALAPYIPESINNFLRYGPKGPPPAPAPMPAPVLAPIIPGGGSEFNAGDYFSNLANRPLAENPQFSRSLRPVGGITQPQTSITTLPSGAGGMTGGATPPRAAVEALRAAVQKGGQLAAQRRQEFDTYYGAGAAAAVLGE